MSDQNKREKQSNTQPPKFLFNTVCPQWLLSCRLAWLTVSVMMIT